nr:unnamed protein product [Callosobruchus chinensis]
MFAYDLYLVYWTELDARFKPHESTIEGIQMLLPEKTSNDSRIKENHKKIAQTFLDGENAEVEITYFVVMADFEPTKPCHLMVRFNGVVSHPSKLSPLASAIPSRQQPYLEVSQPQPFILGPEAGVCSSEQQPNSLFLHPQPG